MALNAFETATLEITRRSHLSEADARGTLRMTLKKAGFDPAAIRADQLAVVVRSLLPRELKIRGVAEPADVCERIVDALSSVSDTGRGPAAERFLERTRG